MTPRCPAPHPSLTVLVPLYNEEENLTVLVESILDVLSSDPDFLELLLIDDGSSDRSVALALELASREPRIRLARHARNRGLGAAIRTGFGEARGDLILYTDADSPFDFHLIPQLFSVSEPDNVVAGYRTNRGEGPRRWLQSKVYNLLCGSMLGLRLRDVNFACKLIPRHALDNIELHSDGVFIDAELLFECRQQGMTITEYPLAYYPRSRGESTLSRPGVIIGTLVEMIRYLCGPTYIRYLMAHRAVRPPLRRYGTAGLAFALALLLSFFLQPITGLSLFTCFLPVIAWIIWYGGFGPALMATVLTTLSASYFFLPPLHSLVVAGHRDIMRLSLFVAIAISLSSVTVFQKGIGYALHRIHETLEETDHQRG